VALGAIPTVTIRDAAQLGNPNPAIAEMLALGAAT
jgi:hypothetical protein